MGVKKSKTVDDILAEAIQKQLNILQDKLNKANDLKSISLLKIQILKVKTELEELNKTKIKPTVKLQEQQLDFTAELVKPDFGSLKIGGKKK